MANEKDTNDKQQTGNEDAAVKPDPETLHTTDPQEHMQGPLSSLMQGVENTFDEDKSDADDDEEVIEKKD